MREFSEKWIIDVLLMAVEVHKENVEHAVICEVKFNVILTMRFMIHHINILLIYKKCTVINHDNLSKFFIHTKLLQCITRTCMLNHLLINATRNKHT